MDGWNAMSRYYLNNFVDGAKQDAIDLIHGHYIVSVNRDMTPPSEVKSLDTMVFGTIADEKISTETWPPNEKQNGAVTTNTPTFNH
ncbi:hypothetical protein ACLOJK_002406 [Asimina triloba]